VQHVQVRRAQRGEARHLLRPALHPAIREEVLALVLRARGGWPDGGQHPLHIGHGSTRSSRGHTGLCRRRHLHVQPTRHVRGPVQARHGKLAMSMFIFPEYTSLTLFCIVGAR
jgi:hypothetical protein